jgi:hypothetical protein
LLCWSPGTQLRPSFLYKPDIELFHLKNTFSALHMEYLARRDWLQFIFGKYYFSVADPDPQGYASILIGWIQIQEGKNDPQK